MLCYLIFPSNLQIISNLKFLRVNFFPTALALNLSTYELFISMFSVISHSRNELGHEVQPLYIAQLQLAIIELSIKLCRLQ